MLDLHVVSLVLPSTCHYTATSSMAAVRSRPRPCHHSLPWFTHCAHRRLALSTWSTTKRNQEMTVRGEADSGSHQFHSRTYASASLLVYTTIFFLHRMLILWIRPIHLFVTAEKSGWVRCYYHVQSKFCLKI